VKAGRRAWEGDYEKTSHRSGAALRRDDRNAALAVSVTTRAQLKVELLDTYKAKPPSPTVKKNDVSLLLGVVYKF
jgi:putative salt-induced outer membrane protein YdiY